MNFQDKNPIKRALFWLALSITALVVYLVISNTGGSYFHVIERGRDLKWNWDSKLLGILFSICAMITLVVIAKFKFSDFGFTLKQRKDSLLTALIVSLVVVGAVWAYAFAISEARIASPEELLFQAIMPGLDEELFFRGVLLLIINQAFQPRWRLLGAKIGLGGILISAFFGFGHGMGFQDGQFVFDFVTIGITGGLAFYLFWLRERTGSLLLPVILHNVINVGFSLIG